TRPEPNEEALEYGMKPKQIGSEMGLTATVMLEAKSNPKGVVAWLGSGGRRWERARWRWLARRWLGGPRLRGCLVAVERELRPAGAEQLFGGHRESKSAPIGRDMSQIDIAADALLRHGVRYIDTHRQDRKSTRLNSSHVKNSSAVSCV